MDVQSLSSSGQCTFRGTRDILGVGMISWVTRCMLTANGLELRLTSHFGRSFARSGLQEACRGLSNVMLSFGHQYNLGAVLLGLVIGRQVHYQFVYRCPGSGRSISVLPSIFHIRSSQQDMFRFLS